MCVNFVPAPVPPSPTPHPIPTPMHPLCCRQAGGVQLLWARRRGRHARCCCGLRRQLWAVLRDQVQGHPGPQVGGAEEGWQLPAPVGSGRLWQHSAFDAIRCTPLQHKACTPPCLPCSADGSVDLDRSDACYDTTTRVVVKIVDTCPCKGNEVHRGWQHWRTGRWDGAASQPAHAKTSLTKHCVPHRAPTPRRSGAAVMPASCTLT